jgi:hypothetical protein
MFQIVASLMIVILTTLEVSFMLLESSIMLLENMYGTEITHDETIVIYHHPIFIVSATGFAMIACSDFSLIIATPFFANQL